MVEARAAAVWRDGGDLWLDHVSLKAEDHEWLAAARWLTLWTVKVPDGLLASLPHLEFLDLRGGSGTSLRAIEGCHRLRLLEVNQIRGVNDLDVLPTLTSLELLSLYGQPQVTRLPSFAPLTKLRRAELGSLKGLSGLTGLHDAPVLEELVLMNVVGVAADDASRLAAHRTLTHFSWFADSGPPDKVWVPFQETVAKPRARLLHTHEWFGRPLPWRGRADADQSAG